MRKTKLCFGLLAMGLAGCGRGSPEALAKESHEELGLQTFGALFNKDKATKLEKTGCP